MVDFFNPLLMKGAVKMTNREMIARYLIVCLLVLAIGVFACADTCTRTSVSFDPPIPVREIGNGSVKGTCPSDCRITVTQTVTGVAQEVS